MPIQTTPKIWMNGELVDWDKAQIHVLTHTLHYGTGVFEGIRAYETADGPAVFRLTEHIKRLENSAKIVGMELPYTVDELVQATKDTVKSTGLPACYVRPIAYYGYGEMGLNTLPCRVDVAIACWPWGAYLGAEGLEKGVDVQVSSWRRMAPDTLNALAKIGGQYVNSQNIVMEAKDNGFTEGIALDVNGYVSEGSGENIFVIVKGQIYTPPLGNSILGGITRDCALVIAKDLGYTVKETVIPRELLYMADEIFFTGTAAEITPIRSVDRLPVGAGKRGPITEKIQSRFFGIITGELADEHGWFDPIK